MITFIQTLLWFALTVGVASLAGYGVATFLLPKEYDEYRFGLMPVVGYPSIVLTTHFISGSFHLSVLESSVIAFGFLAAFSAYAFWITDRHTGLWLFLRRAANPVILSLPMLLVILWPMFYV